MTAPFEGPPQPSDGHPVGGTDPSSSGHPYESPFEAPDPSAEWHHDSGEGFHEPADVAVGGIRNAILRFRISRAVGKSERLNDSAEVLAEMAASNLQGSGSLPTTPRHYQKGYERRHNIRQAIRGTKFANAGWRMDARADSYGTTDDNGNMFLDLDEEGKPQYEVFDGSVTEGQRALNFKLILKGGEEMPDIPYGYTTTRHATIPSDLNDPARHKERLDNGRYSRGRVRSETKARNQQANDAAERERLGEQMEAAANGEDFIGRAVSSRADKHEAKANRLAEKLAERERKQREKRDRRAA